MFAFGLFNELVQRCTSFEFEELNRQKVDGGELIHPLLNLRNVVQAFFLFRKTREEPPPDTSGVLTFQSGINKNIAILLQCIGGFVQENYGIEMMNGVKGENAIHGTIR